MSGFLLDTDAFIWLTENDSSLPDIAFPNHMSYIHHSPLLACGEGVGGGVLVLHSTDNRYNLRMMINTADTVYLSIASLWEISIKFKLNLGKLSLQQSYETISSAIDASDILIIPISFADTVQVRNLPLHHGDPFDRMLIAQAINHSLIIISRDKKFNAYSVQRMW